MLLKYLLPIACISALSCCTNVAKVSAKLCEFAQRKLAEVQALDLTPRPIQIFFINAFAERDIDTIPAIMQHLPDNYTMEYLEDEEIKPDFLSNFWYRFAEDLLTSLCDHGTGPLTASLQNLIIAKSYPLFPEFADYFQTNPEYHKVYPHSTIQETIENVFTEFALGQLDGILRSNCCKDCKTRFRDFFRDFFRRYVASKTTQNPEFEYHCRFLVLVGVKNVQSLSQAVLFHSESIEEFARKVYEKIHNASAETAGNILRGVWPELYDTLPSHSRTYDLMLEACVKAEGQEEPTLSKVDFEDFCDQNPSLL